MMQQLLENGVDHGLGDYDNRTAMHLAASEGAMDVLVYLVSCHADVNVLDRFGGCPLEDAIHAGHTLVAQYISSKGGKLEPRKAMVSMCRAAHAGNVLLLRMLADNGCSVNVCDYDGRTPLHYAASEGQILAVHFLLYCSAYCTEDRRGATALLCALENGHIGCAKLLAEGGAALGTTGEAHPRKAEFEEMLANAPPVDVVGRKVQNMLHRVEGVMKRGTVPSSLAPAVVSDAKLCHRTLVKTIDLISPVREVLGSCATDMENEFYEDTMTARKLATTNTTVGCLKMGAIVVILQRYLAPELAKKRQEGRAPRGRQPGAAGGGGMQGGGGSFNRGSFNRQQSGEFSPGRESSQTEDSTEDSDDVNKSEKTKESKNEARGYPCLNSPPSPLPTQDPLRPRPAFPCLPLHHPLTPLSAELISLPPIPVLLCLRRMARARNSTESSSASASVRTASPHPSGGSTSTSRERRAPIEIACDASMPSAEYDRVKSCLMPLPPELAAEHGMLMHFSAGPVAACLRCPLLRFCSHLQARSGSPPDSQLRSLCWILSARPAPPNPLPAAPPLTRHSWAATVRADALRISTPVALLISRRLSPLAHSSCRPR